MNRKNTAEHLRRAAAKLEALADCIAAEEYTEPFALGVATALQHIAVVVGVMDGEQVAVPILAAVGALQAEHILRKHGISSKGGLEAKGG